jgi:hypothetical protein
MEVLDYPIKSAASQITYYKLAAFSEKVLILAMQKWVVLMLIGCK